MGRDNIAGVVRVHRWRIPSARTLAQSFATPPALQRNITMPRQSTNRAELEAVIAATVQSARSARNAEGETGCGVWIASGDHPSDARSVSDYAAGSVLPRLSPDMPRLILAASALLLPSLLAAQDPRPAAPAAPKPSPVVPVPATTLPRTMAPRPTRSGITTADLMTRLYIFADDSMMGREAGTKGNTMGTDYLAREVARLGLVPAGENGTYFQTLPLKVTRVDTTSSMSLAGVPLNYGKDWFPIGTQSLSVSGASAIFGGSLGDSTRLTSEQVAGKLVVLMVPLTNAAIGAALQGSELVPAGAAGVALLLPAPVLAQIRNYVDNEGSSKVDDGATASPTRLFVAASAMVTLFDKPLTQLALGAIGGAVQVDARITATPVEFPARNVVAILPGSDPALKGQYVAIGAHNDHVGLRPTPADHDSLRILTHIVRPGGAEDASRNANAAQQTEINTALAAWRANHPARPDSIFNGADDDGSGSVSVLEIAESMVALKVKPKRSMLFVWHVGEEKGLWGSHFFIEHPTVPRDSIVAQLNIDMIGRGNAWDVTGESKDKVTLHGSPDYLQVIGSRRLSTELGDLVERVNTSGKHKLAFDYAMDANGHPMNIYCRSDHYEYARQGIPIAFFTTGGHSDYHQITDEPQYIDYPHMQRVATFVSSLAQTIANLDHRVLVDQPKLDPKGTCKQ